MHRLANLRSAIRRLVARSSYLAFTKMKELSKSLLKNPIMNQEGRLLAFTYFRTVFRNKEQFSAQAEIFLLPRVSFFRPFVQWVHLTTPDSIHIAFRNCMRAAVSKPIIKRHRWKRLGSLSPREGERSQRHVTSRICRLRRPICAIISRV